MASVTRLPGSRAVPARIEAEQHVVVGGWMEAKAQADATIDLADLLLAHVRAALRALSRNQLGVVAMHLVLLEDEAPAVSARARRAIAEAQVYAHEADCPDGITRIGHGKAA